MNAMIPNRCTSLIFPCALLLACTGCGGGGLSSSESAQLRDVPQLQVYELKPDGSKELGLYRYDYAVGVTQQDKPILIERLESALHGSVEKGQLDSDKFEPDYAVDAGAMVIAFDLDTGIAEVAREGQKRLVQSRTDIAESLKTILDGKTLAGG